jgi:hypothetical protein
MGTSGNWVVEGGKWCLLADAFGLPAAAQVITAELSNLAGARKLLPRPTQLVPRLQTIWADAAYHSKKLAERR